MFTGLFKRKEATHHSNTDLLSSEEFKLYNEFELSNVLGGGEEMRPYVPAYHFTDPVQDNRNMADSI